MNEIIEILMRRDGISQLEAENLVRQTQNEIDDSIFYGAGIEEVEEILAYNLGLELDYLDILLLG